MKLRAVGYNRVSTDELVEFQTYKLIQHIDKIVIYRDYFEIFFDFLKNVKVENVYLDENEHKKYQYVDLTIYLIPQTDI